VADAYVNWYDLDDEEVIEIMGTLTQEDN